MTFVRRLTFASLLCVAALAPLAAKTKTHAAHAAESDAPYKGAVVIDAATGNVLFERNPDEVGAPASMTKMMTFAVLHDKLVDGSLTLATPVPIDLTDARIGGTQVFLDPRETFSVEELVYAMMIQSANDAAHALARFSAGSPEAFVALMNAKARALGMTHTTFRSPHGLPPPSRHLADGDLTTPRDFAILARYLVQKTDVIKYTSVKVRDFAPARAKGPQRMENHNKLLGRVAGVDGLKTGYTEGAGYCLTATAERSGHRIIVVIMGSFGPGGQIDKGKARDLKAVELIQQGFAALAAGSAPFVATPDATPANAAATKASESPISAAPLAPGEKAATTEEPAIKFAIPKQKK